MTLLTLIQSTYLLEQVSGVTEETLLELFGLLSNNVLVE